MVKVLIFASGGGHTAYAVAIGERLREFVDVENIVFITPENDRWSRERIYRRVPGSRVIEITKPLKPLEPYTVLLKRLAKALRESLKYIGDEPSILVCTGSNHNLIPTLIAKFLKKHLVFCVEDVFRIEKRSRTVSLLYSLTGATVFLQWRIQKRLYRRNIYAGLVYEKPVYKTQRKDYILVTTGTIGNRELFKLLMKTGLDNLVIQSGAVDLGRIVKRRGWKIFRFDPDIDRWIANASLVIASPGITAINAAQAYRKPTVMVYNPDIVLGASFKEIEYVADQLGIPFIDPSRITAEEFEELVKNPGTIDIKVQPDGGLKIARYIASIIETGVYA